MCFSLVVVLPTACRVSEFTGSLSLAFLSFDKFQVLLLEVSTVLFKQSSTGIGQLLSSHIAQLFGETLLWVLPEKVLLSIAHTRLINFVINGVDRTHLLNRAVLDGAMVFEVVFAGPTEACPVIDTLTTAHSV